MTISEDRGTELTVDQIVVTAYQLCGVIDIHHGTDDPQWEKRRVLAYRLLDTIIDSWQTRNIQARLTTFYNLPLTAGTYIYNLPATVLDVLEDAMYIGASELDITKASNETYIKQISREEWHQLSTKNAEATPTMFFTDRNASPIRVYLWNIPDEAGTIRFQVHMKLADAYQGQATLELRSYWMQPVIWELAFQLSVSNNLPVESRSQIRKVAKEQLEYARIYSSERTPSYAHITHETPWRSR